MPILCPEEGEPELTPRPPGMAAHGDFLPKGTVRKGSRHAGETWWTQPRSARRSRWTSTSAKSYSYHVPFSFTSMVFCPQIPVNHEKNIRETQIEGLCTKKLAGTFGNCQGDLQKEAVRCSHPNKVPTETKCNVLSWMGFSTEKRPLGEK